MSIRIWRMPNFEVRAKFVDCMVRISEAEQRGDHDRYMEILDEIKTLPNFPIDLDPIEDVCHIEVAETIIA